MNRRRPLALLFTDISRSTALSASLEPEDYADLLSDLRAAIGRIVEQQSGILVRIDGDGALCAFGYPEPLEAAGRHATLCALAVHEAAIAIARRRHLPDFALHSGIHAGLVLVREGDVVRGRIEVLGDATNIAARLCDAANSGEILVSSAALSGDAAMFEFADRRVMTLADVEQPLVVHSVLCAKPAQKLASNNARIGQSNMVGRAAEIAALADWLGQTDGPSACLISGEPGSGKTRLLHAADALACEAGWTVLHGQCQSDYLAAPLQALAGMIAQFGPWQDTDGDTAALFDAIKSDLLAKSERARVLLLIDDWQWADDTALRLIEQVLAKSKGGLRVLLSSREAKAPRLPTFAYARLMVSPLSEQETAQMALALVPHVDLQCVRQIQALSNGNPLMIEELCRDPDVTLSKAVRVRPSFRIASLVQQRLSRLQPDVAEVLELCAVIGARIPVALLSELTESTGIDAQHQPLIDADFLVVDAAPGWLAFRHILVREAIYDQLPPKRRRALHQAVATNLLGHKDNRQDWGFAEQLAHHLLASNNPAGLDYAREAGDAAMMAGSLGKAQAHFRAMIEFLRHNPNLLDITQLARISNRLGASVLPDPHPEHIAPLNDLLVMAKRQNWPALAARIQYWLAALHYTTGNPQHATRLLDEDSFAHNFAASGLPPELADGLRGQIAILGLRHCQARPILDAAIAGLATVKSVAHHHSLSYMHGMRAQIRGEQGDFVGAQQDFGRIEILLKGEQPPLYGTILTQKARVALCAQDWGHCCQYALEAEAHGERVGSRYIVVVSRAYFAYASILHEGSSARHLLTLRDTGHWFEEAQCRYAQSLVQSWHADGALRAGMHDEAAGAARGCMALGRRGLRSGQPLAARVLAQLADDARIAAGHLRRAYALARRMDSPREWAATRLVHHTLAALFPDMASGVMALPPETAPIPRYAARGF